LRLQHDWVAILVGTGQEQLFRRNPMTYNASNGNGEFDNNSVCLAAHRHQKKIDDPTESK
jgi:hypothetical protein